MLVRAGALVLILVVAACGSGGMAARSMALLDREHQTMTDHELQSYSQQLSDQLARETRAVRKAGRDRLDAAEAEDTAVLLRQRWNVVRQEMRKRDLLP